MLDKIILSYTFFKLLDVNPKYIKYVVFFKNKKNNKGYIEYYKKRKMVPSLEELNYVVCRIATEYFIKNDFSQLQHELDKIDNSFCKEFILNRIEFVLNHLEKEVKQESL